MIRHKAANKEHQCFVSAANFVTWSQLHPSAFISRSTDILHVSCGLLRALLPPEPNRILIFCLKNSTLEVSDSVWLWLTSFMIFLGNFPPCPIYILFFGIGFCSVVFFIVRVLTSPTTHLLSQPGLQSAMTEL